VLALDRALAACRTDPGTIRVLKGNKPLELRWHTATSDFGLGIADYLRFRAVLIEATPMERISFASALRSAICFSSSMPDSTISSIQ